MQTIVGRKSCTATCTEAGGTCSDGEWGVHSLDAMNMALVAAGESPCTSYHGAWNFAHRPTVSTTAVDHGPGRCYVQRGGDSTCSSTYGDEEARLCKCQ